MFRAEKSGIAADIQQKRFDTYPKQDEEKCIQWIEELLDEDMRCNFYEWLKDGSALCRLFNEVEIDPMNHIPENHCKPTDKYFNQLENINFFLKACEKFGVSEQDLFVTLDLYELNDLAQVLITIFALDRKAHTKGFDGPVLAPKEAEKNQRKFSHKTLNRSKSLIPLQSAYLPGASQKGMTCPGTRRHIINN